MCVLKGLGSAANACGRLLGHPLSRYVHMYLKAIGSLRNFLLLMSRQVSAWIHVSHPADELLYLHHRGSHHTRVGTSFRRSRLPSQLTVDESSLTPYAYENRVQNRQLLVNLHHPSFPSDKARERKRGPHPRTGTYT